MGDTVKNRSVLRIPWSEPTDQGVKWDGVNKLAEPNEEIALGDFFSILAGGAESLIGINYGQVIMDERMWVAHYFIYPRTIVAIMRSSIVVKGYIPDYLKAEYEYRYFRIGCQHKHMKESSGGMWDHKYTCPDCGYSYRTDSSG